MVPHGHPAARQVEVVMPHAGASPEYRIMVGVRMMVVAPAS